MSCSDTLFRRMALLPSDGSLAWTRYLPAVLLACVGVGLVINGFRYSTAWDALCCPSSERYLCAVAILAPWPGAVDFVQGPALFF